MNKYETVFIVDLSMGEEAVEQVVEKFKTLIAANGTIENVDVWGKRRFAYAINDIWEGYYVLVNFEAPADFPKELDRIYNITDGIMRSLTIKRS